MSTSDADSEPVDVAKVIRLKATLEAMRAEVRRLEPDQAARERLARMHNTIEAELGEALPTELRAELSEFSSCCEDNPRPSPDEVRVAQAQVIGWIEGLLQGVRLSLATATEHEPAEGAMPEQPGPLASRDDAAYL